MKRHAILLSVIGFSWACSLAIAAEPPPKQAPREPINIDVGRQLFVDDFLISECSLKRVSHKPRLMEGNPVLKPETLSENSPKNLPVAAVYDDGVFYDPEVKLFKMWYSAGWLLNTCYAESADGIRWERPQINIFGPDNRVMEPGVGFNGSRKRRDGGTVWLDLETKDPAERYKAYQFAFGDTTPGKSFGMPANELFVSADGFHWSPPIPLAKVTGGDNSSIFYDPFRKVWVLCLRRFGVSHKGSRIRVRSYLAAETFRGLAEKSDADVVEPWITTDALDVPDPAEGTEPEIFKFSAGPYESLLVGLYGINCGPEFKHAQEQKRPMVIDLQIGFSRDGFHFDRPDRTPFLRAARKAGTWDRGFLHSAVGICLVVGDELWFYFSAWSGEGNQGQKDAIAGGATGIAVLRRDGFASLDADASAGAVVTRQLVFNGRYPFVNADTKDGELRMEVLDPAGKVIPPYSLENCIPIKTNRIRQRVQWKSGADLAALAGKPVQFRLHLTKGSLYAFWVTPDPNGASHGYVAAGGPDFRGPMDMEGN